MDKYIVMPVKRRYGGRKKVKVRAKNAIAFAARNPKFQLFGPSSVMLKDAGASLVAGPNKIGKAIGFPANQRTKMRYCDQFSNSVTTGGILVNYNYNANSAYDPNNTGAGHQPFTFDTWTTLYDHYTVYKSVITVQFQNCANQTVPIVCGVILADDASYYTDHNTIRECGRASIACLPPGINTPVTVQTTFKQNVFWKGNVDNNSQGGSTGGPNPTDLAIFGVFVQPLDQTTTVAINTVQAMITIDYYVKFGEPKDLAGS